MRFSPLPLLALGLLLASCGGSPPATPPDETSSSSSSSESAVVETRNVTFAGTIRPAGISIYMEGTHRLELSDGRFILLSSETVDLNGYVGEQVETTGSIRPTVEEGGTIMRVEQIRLLDSSSLSSSISATVSSSSASAASASSVSSAAVSSSTAASSLPSSRPAVSSASSALSVSIDVSVQVASMAKQDLSAANWTQAYCSPPAIGFCIPVHRNWYFKSFGTASEALWHVEVGSASVENLSDGAIAVNLLGGSLQSKGVSDNDIRDDGTTVRGYRDWTKDRHVEIAAPAALKAAVEYMTLHLSAMEE